MMVTKCLIVTIMDDDALEANQTFFVTLTTSDDDVDVRNNADVLIIKYIYYLWFD